MSGDVLVWRIYSPISLVNQLGPLPGCGPGWHLTEAPRYNSNFTKRQYSLVILPKRL